MIKPYLVNRRKIILMNLETLERPLDEVGSIYRDEETAIEEAIANLDEFGFFDPPSTESPGETFHDEEEIATVCRAAKFLDEMTPLDRWSGASLLQDPRWDEATRLIAAAAEIMRQRNIESPPPPYQAPPDVDEETRRFLEGRE